MRIVRDERRVQMLSLVGQYATLGGLGALLIGLIISFVRPESFVPMLLSVAVGFLLSIVGGYFADRYAGPLAHHEALAEVLKGLDYRHALLQYVLPAHHVLLEPGGCTAFVVKTQGGRIAYDAEKGKWRHRQRGKFFRQLVGREGLGSPHVEAERDAGKLRDYVSQRLPDADDVPVRGAIVFVNPDVELDAGDSPVPAFYRKKVKSWLRGPGDLEPLPGDLRRRLAEALGVEPEEG